MTDGQRATVAAAETATGVTKNRKLAETLYQKLRNELLDIVLESRELLLPDADHLVDSLAGQLQNFAGETDQQFLEWAESILRPAAEYQVKLSQLFLEHSETVYAAIWRFLETCGGLGVDCSSADQIASEVWTWAVQNVDSLTAPGTAKTSTRLYAKATWAARAWKTKQLREKKRLADIEPEQVGSDLTGNRFVEQEYFDSA